MKNWLFRLFVAPSTPREERAFKTFVETSRDGRASMLLAAYDGLDKEQLWKELKDLMDRSTFDLVCDNARLGHLIDAIDSSNQSYLLASETPAMQLCSCCGGPGPWRTMSVRMNDMDMELMFCGLCDNRLDIIEDSTPEHAMMTRMENLFFTKKFMDYLLNSNGKNYDTFLRGT